MRLVVYCKYCNTRNNAKIHSEDRLEIKKDYGDTFELKCSKCLENNQFRINDIKAEVNPIVNLVFMLSMLALIVCAFFYFNDYLFVSGTIQSVYLVPIGMGIPILIYFTWLGNERKKVNSFNRFRV
ncbi:hypothetical protein GCM10022258_29460 [Aquimarina gracilis]